MNQVSISEYNENAKFEQQMLFNKIEAAFSGTSILVTMDYSTYENEDGRLMCWVSVWNNAELMFTVSTPEQWNAIFEAFRLLFSGPSEAAIIAMFAHSNGDVSVIEGVVVLDDDCIF